MKDRIKHGLTEAIRIEKPIPETDLSRLDREHASTQPDRTIDTAELDRKHAAAQEEIERQTD